MHIQHCNKYTTRWHTQKTGGRRLAYVFLEVKTLQVLAQGHFTEVNEFCLGIILINTFKYTFLPPCKDIYAWEVYGDRHSLKTPS